MLEKDNRATYCGCKFHISKTTIDAFIFNTSEAVT